MTEYAGALESRQPWEIAGSMGGADVKNAQQRDMLTRYMYAPKTLTAGERAWCADFVKASVSRANLPTEGLTPAARSALNYGEPTSQPEKGDLAVYGRGAPGSGQGHVGFYMGEGSPGSDELLSGNASGGAVTTEDKSRGRLLGYRQLAPASSGPEDVPESGPPALALLRPREAPLPMVPQIAGTPPATTPATANAMSAQEQQSILSMLGGVQQQPAQEQSQQQQKSPAEQMLAALDADEAAQNILAMVPRRPTRRMNFGRMRT